MDFFKFIKAVGTGPRHNRDLSQAEMKQAMDLILERRISNEEIGAFLLGWRVKGESVEEFLGTLDSFENHMNSKHLPFSIELGFPSDGKNDNPYIFPLAAKFLKKFNINFTLCKDDLKHAKLGHTILDLANNYEFDDNIFCFHRKEIFPQLSNLNAIRENLKIRTSFDSIEKLTRFANSRAGILGAFHKPFVEKYLEIYCQKYSNFAVIKGNEGGLEIFGKCQVWIFKNSKIEHFTIEPSYYGINYQKSWDKISLEDSISMLKNPSEEILKLAKLNAAVWLFVYDDDTESINEAFDKVN